MTMICQIHLRLSTHKIECYRVSARFVLKEVARDGRIIEIRRSAGLRHEPQGQQNCGTDKRETGRHIYKTDKLEISHVGQ